jgi:hypothetical protein
MKKCKVCKIEKEITQFNPASKYKDKIYYRGECKSCNLLKQSSDQTAQIKYRRSKKGAETKSAYKKTDKYKAYQKEYDKIRDFTPARKLSKYIYIKNRLKEDPFYRLRLNVRNRLRGAMKVKGWHKDNEFSKYIGCSLDILKNHIESQFSSEMTWDNYAKIWEVDHIRALGFAKDDKEIYELCHYTNLKPILIEDHKAKTILDVINIKKSNKVD